MRYILAVLVLLVLSGCAGDARTDLGNAVALLRDTNALADELRTDPLAFTDPDLISEIRELKETIGGIDADNLPYLGLAGLLGGLGLLKKRT